MPDPKENPQQYPLMMGWSAAVENALTPEYARASFYVLPDYPNRFEGATFSSHCWTQHKMPGLLIETQYALIEDLVLTRERYREAGALIAAGIVDKVRETRRGISP